MSKGDRLFNVFLVGWVLGLVVLFAGFAVGVAQSVEPERPRIWVLGKTAASDATFDGFRVIVVSTPARCFYVFQVHNWASEHAREFLVREVPTKELPAGKGCQ